MDERTWVVFRVWMWGCQKGEVIALFPLLFSDGAGRFCESYMHVGQHHGADYDGVIAETRAATYEEYEGLARELEQIGYKLYIRKRAPRYELVAMARDIWREAVMNA